MPSSLETRMRSFFLRLRAGLIVRAIASERDESWTIDTPHPKRLALKRYGASTSPRWGRWIRELVPLPSASCGDPIQAAHVGLQRIGDGDRSIRLLIIFQDGDERASDGKAGSVEGVHEAGGLLA